MEVCGICGTRLVRLRKRLYCPLKDERSHCLAVSAKEAREKLERIEKHLESEQK